MVKTGEWFSRAWQMFSEDAGTWLLIGLVALLMSCIPFVMPAMIVGLLLAVQARLRGERPSMDHLWLGFQSFGPALVAALLVGLLTIVGVIACCVGQFYVATIFALVFPAVALGRLGPTEAMARSREIVGKDFWSWLVFMLLVWVVGIVPILGFVLQAMMWAIAYTEVTGSAQTVAAPAGPPFGTVPPPPPPVG